MILGLEEKEVSLCEKNQKRRVFMKWEVKVVYWKMMDGMDHTCIDSQACHRN
jgi:hypothetical protein